MVRHRSSFKWFLRKRILGFTDLILIQINRLVLSLNVEINAYLDLLGSQKSYSKQAFSQARQKLKHTAFIELNSSLIQDYYSLPTNKYQDKYHLLSVDGSLCQLSDSVEVSNHFGEWKNNTNKGMPMGRVSVVYDICNKLAIDSIISPNNIGERQLFMQHKASIKKLNCLNEKECIYLMDRGYPDIELFRTMIEDGNKFVVRCKSNYRNEILQFIEKEIDESSIFLSFKKGDSNGIHMRVVRVFLKSGEYEYLLTNTDFGIQQLGELYYMRWGIETFYGFIKETMQVENFSAKTTEGVYQDFHACMLTANISSLIIEEAQQELDEEHEQKENKHSYRINKNVALGILKNKIPRLLLSPNSPEKYEKLENKIKHYTIAVVSERSFKRHKLRRSRRKFHMNKKRAI